MLKFSDWWQATISIVVLVVGLAYIMLGIIVTFKQKKNEMEEEEQKEDQAPASKI